MKLNLGCGRAHKEGYINIDIQEPCDLKHDLKTPLPFEDNSVDEIFSEGNTICLFSQNEWKMIKKDIYRVLKPGGKLEIIFLDFEYILRAFLDDKDGKRWGWWWQTIFSGQENEYDFSKNGFSYDKLTSDLHEEGMVDFVKTRAVNPEYIHLICYKNSHKEQLEPMKILIGTPIHISKDYAMERWLENVSKLEYQTDLLMVDNSPGLKYVEKVKGYCKKYGITNYQIRHLEINDQQLAAEKIGRSREIIREEILAKGYDAWFSWESDQIIPINTLDKLVDLMQKGNFSMVVHNSWDRENPSTPTFYFGIALIGRGPLEKYSFLIDKYTSDPDMNFTWYRAEEWFKKQIRRDGGNYIEVCGITGPIYHLNK